MHPIFGTLFRQGLGVSCHSLVRLKKLSGSIMFCNTERRSTRRELSSSASHKLSVIFAQAVLPKPVVWADGKDRFPTSSSSNNLSAIISSTCVVIHRGPRSVVSA
jgi:hypothetical protein